jgi:transcriptional regulator with XRE-family HTH domain
MSFADTLKSLRGKTGKSRYRLAQYSGINEAYILRLERGDRSNPSRETVILLGIALV